jgi:hypothetical protein
MAAGRGAAMWSLPIDRGTAELAPSLSRGLQPADNPMVGQTCPPQAGFQSANETAWYGRC